jgi:hypothetical protein
MVNAALDKSLMKEAGTADHRSQSFIFRIWIEEAARPTVVVPIPSRPARTA